MKKFKNREWESQKDWINSRYILTSFQDLEVGDSMFINRETSFQQDAQSVGFLEGIDCELYYDASEDDE